MKRKIVTLGVALVLVTVLFHVPQALGKTKGKKAVASGPVIRQLSKSIQLANNVEATITIIEDQMREESVLGMIDSKLALASQIDMEIQGDVNRINKLTKGQKAEIGPHTYELIKQSKNLAALTNGWFDIASSKKKGYFSAKDYRKLKLDKSAKTFAFKSDEMQIDVSHILPGYLTDKLMSELVTAGYKNAKVQVGNASRNVGHDIHTPWTVAIGLGEQTSQYARRTQSYSFTDKAVAEITPESLNQPLVDPKSKKEVGKNFHNVTVFAHDALTAEALALAIYTLGSRGAVPFIEKHPEVKVICVNNEGEFITSKGLHINPQNYSQPEGTQMAADQGPDNIKLRKKEEEGK